MICPATGWGFIHNNASIQKRTHRIVTHAIVKQLSGIILYPWISVVINAVSLKKERTFFQSSTGRQSLYLLPFAVKLDHIWFQFCNPHSTATPIKIGLSVFINKHIRINSDSTGNGLFQRGVWTFRPISNGNSNHKSAAIFRFWCCREVEIILSIFFDSIRRPQGIGIF